MCGPHLPTPPWGHRLTYTALPRCQGRSGTSQGRSGGSVVAQSPWGISAHRPGRRVGLGLASWSWGWHYEAGTVGLLQLQGSKEGEALITVTIVTAGPRVTGRDV